MLECSSDSTGSPGRSVIRYANRRWWCFSLITEDLITTSGHFQLRGGSAGGGRGGCHGQDMARWGAGGESQTFAVGRVSRVRKDFYDNNLFWCYFLLLLLASTILTDFPSKRLMSSSGGGSSSPGWDAAGSESEPLWRPAVRPGERVTSTPPRRG